MSRKVTNSANQMNLKFHRSREGRRSVRGTRSVFPTFLWPQPMLKPRSSRQRRDVRNCPHGPGREGLRDAAERGLRPPCLLSQDLAQRLLHSTPHPAPSDVLTDLSPESLALAPHAEQGSPGSTRAGLGSCTRRLPPFPERRRAGGPCQNLPQPLPPCLCPRLPGASESAPTTLQRGWCTPPPL